MKPVNLSNLSLSRLKSNARIPSSIYMLEGDDFKTSKNSRNNPYEIELYQTIQIAINEGIINVNGGSGTTSVLTDNGDGTFTHNNGVGITTTFNEGRSSIVFNGNGTYTLTTSDGSTITLNNNVLTSIINTVVGHRIGTYTDELGNTTDINETNTSLTANANQLEYTREDGTIQTIDLSLFVDDTNLARIVSGVIDPMTYIGTFTRDDSSTFTVDFSFLLGTANTSIVTPITSGNVIASHQDGNATTVNIEETVTTIVDNGNNSFTYVNEAGASVTFTPNSGVVTTLVDNGNSTFTYTNENSVAVTVDYSFSETITTLVDNGNDTMSYTNENGTVVTIPFGDTLTVLSYNTLTDVLTYIDENGGITNIPFSFPSSSLTPIVTGQVVAIHNDGDGNSNNIQESITTFTDNGNGTYTYVSENGTSTTTAVPGSETVTTLVDNGNSTFTYTSENGSITTITYGGVETVTTLTDNGGGSYTYVSENGTVTNFTTSTETVTTFTDNGNGTYTYTSEDGTITTTAVPGAETITSLTDNGNGSFTYVAENAVVTTVTFGETLTSLVDNGNGTLTYTDEGGTPVIITLPTGNTSVITNTQTGHIVATHNDGTGTTVNINETITSLGLVGTTLNYTDEDSTVTPLDLSSLSNPSVVTISVIGNPIATHNDGNGTITTLGETITNLTLNGTNLEYIDEAGATNIVPLTGLDNARVISGVFNSITNIITFTRDDATTFTTDLSPLDSSPSTVAGTVSGHQIAIHTNGDAINTTINETITTLGFVGSILTYTDEDGVLTNLDLSALSAGQPRIISGTLNSGAETLILTRDDTSTVVIDMSSIYALSSTISNTVVGNQIATHVSGAGITSNINETITSFILNGTNLEYTKEDGTLDTINTSSFGSTSIFSNVVVGNQIGTHNDGDGTLVNINETITGLSLSTNTLTYTKEGGTTDVIDLSGFNQLPSIVTPITAGSTIATHNDNDGTIVNIQETITALSFDGTNLNYIDESGTTTPLDISVLNTNLSRIISATYTGDILTLTRDDATTITVSIPESTTSTVTNIIAGDRHRIATHNNGDGVITDIYERITSLEYHGSIANTIVYTNENGVTNNLTISGSLSEILNNQGGHLIAQHDDGTGNVTSINETITDLSFAGNALTYIDESGTSTNLDLSGFDQNFSSISGTVSGHTIATHNSGNFNFVDINETITSLNVVGSNLEYVDEDGTNNSIPITSFQRPRIESVQYFTSTIRLVRDDSSYVEIDKVFFNSKIDQLVSGHKIFRHRAANGLATDVFETVTSLSLLGSVLTYTNENGVNTNLTLPSGGTGNTSIMTPNNLVGNLIADHNDGTGSTTDLYETITTLGLVGTTLTYTDEVGNPTVLTLPSGGGGGTISSMSSVSPTGNIIGIHNDGNGTNVNVRETVTGLSISGSTLTYTDEDSNDTDITLPSGGSGSRGASIIAPVGNSTVSVPGGYYCLTIDSGSAGFLTTLTVSPSNGDTVDIIRLIDNSNVTFSSGTIKFKSGAFTTTANFPVSDESITRCVYVSGTWYCAPIT